MMSRRCTIYLSMTWQPYGGFFWINVQGIRLAGGVNVVVTTFDTWRHLCRKEPELFYAYLVLDCQRQLLRAHCYQQNVLGGRGTRETGRRWGQGKNIYI